jgi:hypothetical protein
MGMCGCISAWCVMADPLAPVERLLNDVICAATDANDRTTEREAVRLLLDVARDEVVCFVKCDEPTNDWWAKARVLLAFAQGLEEA